MLSGPPTARWPLPPWTPAPAGKAPRPQRDEGRALGAGRPAFELGLSPDLWFGVIADDSAPSLPPL